MSFRTAIGHFALGFLISGLFLPLFAWFGGYWTLLTVVPGSLAGIVSEVAQQTGLLKHEKQTTTTAVLDALEFVFGALLLTVIGWTILVIYPQCQGFCE